MSASLVGSEMCIRDRAGPALRPAEPSSQGQTRWAVPRRPGQDAKNDGLASSLREVRRAADGSDGGEPRAGPAESGSRGASSRGAFR
eukprot:4666966-Alexandrium_andersonii.AAC.1